MRNKLLHLSLASLLVGGLFGQSASDPNSGLTISHNSSLGEFSLSWWGIDQHYYFVLETEDLVDEPWVYFPYAAKGSDAAMGPPPFAITASKMFFRLEYTDDPNSELLSGDFDGDFVSNKDEIDNELDPFGWVSTDGDFIADDWEQFYFGDLTQTDAGNDDADYTNNLEESELGLDPTVDETGMALTYTYDDAGRLTAVGGNSTTLAYTLDEEGNITLAD